MYKIKVVFGQDEDLKEIYSFGTVQERRAFKEGMEAVYDWLEYEIEEEWEEYFDG